MPNYSPAVQSFKLYPLVILTNKLVYRLKNFLQFLYYYIILYNST